jgi:transglutaminase-like putative cysteine protease
MQIRIGYELVYQCPQPTPMVATLSVHYSRASDLLRPDHMICSPSVPLKAYRDTFGNWCTRLVAPAGRFTMRADTILRDDGAVDPVRPELGQVPVENLPEESLLFLLPSRFCESDLLADAAWTLFHKSPPGWKRVQAICDFVHQHIVFGYGTSSPQKTAAQVYADKRGVCRDFAHLAVAFCRAMNIPARYCTGYLGDIGLPPPYPPMDFAAWFEAYVGDGWYTFDPRNNEPRAGRILIARGRDAADVALTTTFGPTKLESFSVITDELPSQP